MTLPNLPLVIDVSRYQNKINWRTVATRNVTAAIIRATVGDYYVDPRLTENWIGSKNNGLISLVYHVITPELDATKQMEWLKRNLAERGIVQYLPVVLDCELSRNQDAKRITAVIEKCVDYAVNWMEIKPIIYTRATWWNVNVLPSTHWKELPLHAARYADYLTSPWSDGKKYQMRDWKDWFLWQYTDDGDGRHYGTESAAIDLNLMNGTRETLLKMGQPSQIPSPPPDPVQTPVLSAPIGIARVAVSSLTLRSEPLVASNTTVGSIRAGRELYVYEMVERYGNLWARVGHNVWAAQSYKQSTIFMEWMVRP